MLRINRNTSALTVSLLFGLLSTTSCGFDDGYDKEDTGDDNVKVAFRMAFVNDNTRAVNDGWEDYDPTDPGDAYENAINADQLQIKVCDKDGNIIGDVQDVRVIDDQITGTWENAGDLLKQANKIMVFANCGTANITKGNIASLAFSVNDTKQYIPMWGVTTLTKDLVVGKQNNLGTIDLLRSLAKVKVKMAGKGSADGMKARGYALGNITFNNYNTEGYALPQTYINAVICTEDERVDECIGVISNCCKQRTEIVPGTATMGLGIESAMPMQVTVGGATIMVTNVERFEKL